MPENARPFQGESLFYPERPHARHAPSSHARLFPGRAQKISPELHSCGQEIGLDGNRFFEQLPRLLRAAIALGYEPEQVTGFDTPPRLAGI